MKRYDADLKRLGTLLLFRGFALLALAGIAVRWPEQSMVGMVKVAGVLAIILGIAELGIAMAGPALASTRYFRVGHSLTSITFGIAAAAAAGRPLDEALTLALLWLAVYAAFLLLLAARLWYFRRMRDGLVLWAAGNVGALVLAANTLPATSDDLLVAGALYTAILGVITIAAARWMRQGWMLVERRPVP